MKQNKALLGLHVLIPTAIYCASAFVLADDLSFSFWVGILFTVLDAAALTVLLFRLSAENLKRTFLGLPAVYICAVFFGAQALWGLVLIYTSWISKTAGLVVSFVLTGGLTTSVASALLGQNVISSAGEKINRQTAVMRRLEEKAAALSGPAADRAIKPDLEHLLESMRYSDPVSVPQTAAAEKELEELFSELELCVAASKLSDAKTICGRLEQKIAERNRLAKSSK